MRQNHTEAAAFTIGDFLLIAFRGTSSKRTNNINPYVQRCEAFFFAVGREPSGISATIRDRRACAQYRSIDIEGRRPDAGANRLISIDD